MRRSIILSILTLFVFGGVGAVAGPQADDDAPEADDGAPEADDGATRAAAVAAAFRPLPELMVKGQLAACRGVEVHRRGDGFIAGRVDGPVVLIRAAVTCTQAERKGEQEALIHASWSARFPDSDDEVEIDSRTIDPVRMTCPVEIGAHILKELKAPPRHVCRHTFQRMWEDFGLADFFVPVLVPTGKPRFGERDGLPTLLFERGDRRLELSGRVRCKKVNSEVMFGEGDMGLKVLVADIRLVDVGRGRVLGQWNEELVGTPAISCDLAFRRPSSPEKMDAARALWAQKIADAIDQ